MKTNQSLEAAERYYAGNFPAKLHCHPSPYKDGVTLSISEDAEDLAAVFCEITDPQQAAFVRELARRWNHSVKRESALMDIKEMAGKRKSCIRMANGMMLDTFCGQSLL